MSQDSADDFDILSNLNTLNDPIPVKFSDLKSPDDTENSALVDTDDPFDLSLSPQRKQAETLSSSKVEEMSKKGQQLMKRYQKKQEVVQRQTQRKVQADMRRQLAQNSGHRTSTPQGRRRSGYSYGRYGRYRRNRNWFGWFARRAPAEESDEDMDEDDDDGDDDDDDGYENSPGAAALQARGSFGNAHQSTSISSMDLSREIDQEITIKLKWKDTIERIPFRFLQPFHDLFQILATREGVSPNLIVLLMENKFVGPTDTPSSLGYTSVNFISGRVVMEEMLNAKDAANKSKAAKKTGLKLKIQSDRLKRPFPVEAQKTDTVGHLLRNCALQLKCNPEEIKLKFDGEVLDKHMTLLDLDLEGGELLDCVFVGGQ